MDAIGIKLVVAEPMSSDEAIKKGYKISKENTDGYEVIYEDGYASWCPKDVFEKNNIIDDSPTIPHYTIDDNVPDFIKRLVVEYDELYDRYTKLDEFIKNNKTFTTLDDEHKHYLTMQRKAMYAYVIILSHRIEKLMR